MEQLIQVMTEVLSRTQPQQQATTPQWKASEVGYFWPDLQGDSDIIDKDDKCYYRTVYAFTNRVRVFGQIRDKATICKNLDTCLRGEALSWWNNELDRTTRLGLQQDNDIEPYCLKLEARFKPTPSEALRKLQNTRYTPLDARNKKSVTAYISEIVTAAKASNQGNTEFAQVLLAWTNLDLELRETIDEPQEGTTIGQFMETLQRKQTNWFDKYANYSMRSAYRGTTQRTQAPQTQYNYRQQHPQAFPRGYGRGYQQYYSPSSGQGPRNNNNNNDYQQPRYQPPQASLNRSLAPPPQRLQITAAPSNESRPPPNTSYPRQAPTYYPRNALDNNEHRNQQWANRTSQPRPQAAYVTDEYYEDNHEGQDIQDTHWRQGDEDPGEQPFADLEPTEPPQDNNGPPVDAFFSTSDADHVCRRCHTSFPSNNKLHKHLHDCYKLNSPTKKAHPLTEIGQKQHRVIKSVAAPDTTSAFGFRSWHYAVVRAGLTLQDTTAELCVDTGCNMSLIDRAFLKRLVPNCTITQYEQAIPVRGIGERIHNCSEYATFDLYIPGTVNGQPAIAQITRGARIVEGLRANMLIGMDILGPEDISMIIPKRELHIGSCNNLITSISITPKSARVQRVVCAKKEVKIPPGSATTIPIKLKGKGALPKGRDLLFEPAKFATRLGLGGGIVAHLVDADTALVEARNTTDKAVTIAKNCRLGRINEIDADGYFLATPEDRDLATGPVNTDPKIYRLQSNVPESKTAQESTLNNGITLYGDDNVRKQLAEVALAYPKLWEDNSETVDIPEDQYLTIPLKPDSKVEAAKVYPLGPRDQNFVDKVFDELHSQSKMEWTTRPTPHGYPVFVVWKTVYHVGKEPERKGRVVVDIRGLNKITETDAYPIPLQSEITAAVQGCPYISTMDAASFFYQWPIAREDRHKLTVISHRGQEQFRVAAMGYKNSPPYVQRQIDRILRPYRHFARAYVDDIVIYGRTFQEHLQQLHTIFALLQRLRIHLNPSKTYLGYPNIQLLGQHVDALGLTTAQDKIEAIIKLKFPQTLQELETYLGLTGWLRNYIEKYAQKAAPLQLRKTKLLRGAPNKGRARRVYSTATIIEEPTEEELIAFKTIQQAFGGPKFLIHFDPSRQLYIDLDASKQRGFGVIVYHLRNIAVANGEEHTATPGRLQPILFLSKLLTTAESRYWPTELEVAGLVWTVRRIRHMIEAAEKKVIVFTDHAASTAIACQTKLQSSNIDRLNQRLIRASAYLSQFNLDVRHKPGKEHILPDALSRLASEAVSKNDGEEVLDLHAEAYHTTLVEMSKEMKSRIVTGYKTDKAWTIIWDLLHQEQARDEDNGVDDKTGLAFYIQDELIYHDDGVRPRICLPQCFEKEVFALAHDKNAHVGFYRAYQRITESVYMHRLSRRLRKYIAHCPPCQLYQTKRHRPYGHLVPIESPAIPFHTIAMDFIVGLPRDPDGDNTLLTITDKFTKRVTLLAGQDTDTAEDWARKVINRLLEADWGIPRAIISDRDAKFMSGFWKTTFKQLGVSMLTATAYHPQTDGQSERTNQTIEIALRFLLAEHPDIHWTGFLPALIAIMNNSVNRTTGRTPTELMYGFRINEGISLLNVNTDYNPQQKIQFRKEAAEALSFANTMTKTHYDNKRLPLFLKPGDMAYLRLHHGYTIAGKPNRKLGQQRVGPFRVMRRVGRLAYELELPSNFRIHPVVSIAQLEPALSESDPYGRPRPDHPDAIVVDGDTEEWKSYEIERVLDKRERRYGRKTVIEYLVRWKGYGSEFDQWYGLDLLDNATGLIDDYESNHLTPIVPSAEPRTARITARRIRKATAS